MAGKTQIGGDGGGGVVIPVVGSLPLTGQAGEVLTFSFRLHGWDGSAFEGYAYADEVDAVAADLATHEARTDNPHAVTPTQIGAATAAQGAKADTALQPGSIDTLAELDAIVTDRDLTADAAKLDGIEAGATADQTAAEIEAAYNAQVAAASQAEMEAGTETAIRRMSPLRVAQAISAQAGSGSGVAVVSVASIDDPSPELSARSESAEGTLVLCIETSGQSTLYQWVSTSTADGAYVVAGSSGFYEAIAGHFIHSDGNVLRDHGLWLDEPTGLASLQGWSIGFAPAGGGSSQFRIQPDGLHYNTAHILDVSSTAGVTLPAGKTLTIGGHAVDDIKVAADAASSGDDELLTAGYLNARLASQAEQEAATSTTQMVSPGAQHFHPSAAKAWCFLKGDSAPASISEDYGVSSVTDNGTGDYTLSWSTAFATATYSWSCNGNNVLNDASNRVMVALTTLAYQTTGSLRILTKSLAGGGSMANQDHAIICISVFGDH